MGRRKQGGPRKSNAGSILDRSGIGDEPSFKKTNNSEGKERRSNTDEHSANENEGRSQQRRKRLRRSLESQVQKQLRSTIVCPDLSGKEVGEIHLLNVCLEQEGLSKEVYRDVLVKVMIECPKEGPYASLRPTQVLSSTDVSVSLAACSASILAGNSTGSSEQSFQVLVSGRIDASNSVLSSLVYLIRRDYITLLPVWCSSGGTCSCTGQCKANTRLRVVLIDKAFTESFHASIGKNMQKVMSWLRPDLHPLMKRSSEEAIEQSGYLRADQRPFDPTALYAAVKPSRSEYAPEMNFPQLLPQLRPYQRRAAFWMVQRERGHGLVLCSPERMCNGFWSSDVHPLWIPVFPDEKPRNFYYNPMSGAVGLEPRDYVSYVKGGILADEMGLGKTVELLACILANPNTNMPSPSPSESAKKNLEKQLLSRKRSRVECVCGAVQDQSYKPEWVKCGICDAWQHCACVSYTRTADYAPVGINRNHAPQRTDRDSVSRLEAVSRTSSNLNSNPEGSTDSILDREHEFRCRDCREIIASVEVEGVSGATLVVCPTVIFRQWQEEILRHTEQGSLRVIVYEGVAKGSYFLARSSGTGETKRSRIAVVSPYVLAGADIVLTTYLALRSDLHHDADKSKVVQRSMRYAKRHPKIPTPLTRLKWWRVCLDEAQMVEHTTTQATEMALLLNAENRWCMSGTPIQRGLDDLFGLLKFLQAKPFDDLFCWNQALQLPYEVGEHWAAEYLHKFMKVLMWRSSKIDVKDELNLPDQQEDVTWLKLSPVDAYFYRQQYEKFLVKARAVLDKHGKQLREAQDERAKAVSEDDQTHGASRLPSADVVVLSGSLRELRQACCHPQVGRSGIGSLRHKKPMTMKSILQKLLDQARVSAMEAQRNLVAALNGLAGLAIIENDVSKAETMYEEALSLIDKNPAEVDVDPFQRLHTLHNMAELLKGTGTTASTARADVLLSRCTEIRSQYLGALVIKHDNEKVKFRSTSNQVNEAVKVCDDAGGPNWWLEITEIAEHMSEDGEELVEKIKNHLVLECGRAEHASSLVHRFHRASGLKLLLQNELDVIQERRGKVLAKLKELEKLMDSRSVEYAERHANCKNHSEENGDECAICEMETLFQEYASRLYLQTAAGKGDGTFSYDEDGTIETQRAGSDDVFGPEKENRNVSEATGRRFRETNASQGTVLAIRSETEEVLSLIRTYARVVEPKYLDVAKRHLQIFETWKKEYNQMRKWVTSQKEVLNALDELNTVILRHRLQVPGERIETFVEKKVIIHPEEVPVRKMQLEFERDEAKHRLTSAEGTLRYLQGLASRDEGTQPIRSGSSSDSFQVPGGNDAEEENTCKICYTKFGVERMMLRCAHFFCNTCCTRLMRLAATSSVGGEKCIVCPTCRQTTNVKDVSFVVDGVDKYVTVSHTFQSSNCDRDREERGLKVLGDYGTKVGAIVRRMLWIKLKTPLAKVIVFSTWHDVLEVIGHAFAENNIRFARVRGSSLIKALSEFQTTRNEHVSALLLPYQRCSNGLNLVEAQHVFLVEPLPTPGVEAQAVNRVHRIGQTQDTFVHRFVVLDTVEEKIFELGRAKAKPGEVEMSKKGQSETFSLNDMKTLFASDIVDMEVENTPCEEGEAQFRNIPPAVAAGAAAEARRIASLAGN